MRLAADYEQKNSHKQQISNRQITRLGKGGQQQVRRKRGISRSQQNTKIQNMSLGKNEVSRQKLSELQRTSFATESRNTKVETMPQIFVTATCYGNRSSHPIEDYASQHLLMTAPSQFPTQQYAQPVKCLNAVRSQQTFYRNHQQQSYRSTSKISINQARRQVYIPNRIYSPVYHQKQTCFRQSNQPRQVSHSPQINIKVISPQINSTKNIPKNVPVIHSPRKDIKITYQESRALRNPQTQHNINNIINQEQTPRMCPAPQPALAIKSQKVISSKQNPFRMSGTKKHEETAPRVFINEELKATKKQIIKNPHERQIQKMAENNDSKMSKKKVTSLWEANKTESIVSQHLSDNIKVEQSEIMINYFNSKH